ncbi:MAG: hypothetical protein ABIR59_03685 [Gemmatimonadales bacterium]
MPEDTLMAAIRELQSLSRIPIPIFRVPPWAAVRAALPPGITLPQGTVHVLVDFDIDVTGTVVRASVGDVPASMSSRHVVAACVGPDGKMAIQPPLDAASPELAQAVAAGHLGAKFTPGERDGHAVSVRNYRMGIEVPPAALRSSATL